MSIEDDRKLAIRIEAQQDLYFFSRYMFKERRKYKWRHNWHHRVVCDALMKVFNGEIKRLIINIPPRYSKTELAVINFMAWCFGKVPDSEFIHISYSATLAANNAFQTRNLVQEMAFKNVFPDFVLRDDSKAKDDWRTKADGVCYAQGTGGTITGFGAGKIRESFGGAIIIDDPHKASEAKSKTIREGVIEWFQNTLESAQASEAAIQQFIQAMQGGVLRGEEFNSIMENGYGLAEALAKGLGVTTGELRKMAENGELSAERVLAALAKQKAGIDAQYSEMPSTIGKALQKIATSWQILIGEMDQANGVSATVAQWLSVLADNLNIVEVLLKDIGSGFVWFGDQLKKIDPQTIEALKIALLSAYDAVKSLGTLLEGAFERGVDVINTMLGQIFNFSSGIDAAADKTNGFTKALQAVNVVFGFISDGFKALNIGINLIIGAAYDAAGAFSYWKSKITFGDTSAQALKDFEVMSAKAQEYYKKSSDGAMEFKSAGVEAIRQIGLLDAPYSPTRSFTQENERTSVQLVQAELDRVNSDIVLNWELIDALGWVLPANSLSYSNLTPIAAIKLIADAAGGFVYSEPDSNTFTIRAKYKKTFWDSIAIDEYDRVIPESVVTDLSTDYTMYPDYNGVFLTNDRNGNTGQVKRVGTAGDVLQESVNSPLLTSTTAMHSKGREVLAKAGMVETHSLLMPITQEIGQCLPGELTAFNGDWWGISDGVSGSFSYEKVTQTTSIERVNRE